MIDRKRLYKYIHMSSFYKDLVNNFGIDGWRSYLYRRFGVSSSKELDDNDLLNLSKEFLCISSPRNNSVHEGVRYYSKDLEPMSYRQRIKLLYTISLLKERKNIDDKAISSFMVKLYGDGINIDNIPKKDASKFIAILETWLNYYKKRGVSVMDCPFCGHNRSKVLYTISDIIKERYRVCEKCKKTFITEEVLKTTDIKAIEEYRKIQDEVRNRKNK